MGEENLCMLGRLGNCKRMRKVQTEFFHVFKRLKGTVRPVDISQRVKMDIPHYMGISNILRKDFIK
jgi:hypothetical protein